MGYSAKNVVKNGVSVVVGASETNTVVTGTGPLDGFSVFDPVHFRLDIVCSAVTVATGITAKLQNRFSNEAPWVDSKTVTITDAGTFFSINLLPQVAGDQAFLPLRPQCRLVITSGVGDTATIDAVYVPSC